MALGGAVFAQGPADNSQKAISDWMRTNNVTEMTANPAGRWNIAGGNAESVALWAVLGMKDASGQARVALRVEYFTPKARLGAQALSEMQRINVDCAGQRLRIASLTTFTQHNFLGERMDRELDNAWQPVSDIQALTQPIQTACGQSGGTAAAAAPPPFDIRDQRAARRWITDNRINLDGVENARWEMIGVTTLGIWFAKENLEQTMSSARTTPTLVLRFERFQTIPKADGQGQTQSELVFYEINCTTRQTRRTGVNQYDTRNLTGRANSFGTGDTWTPVTQNAMINSIWGEVCAATTRIELPTTDRFDAGPIEVQVPVSPP